MTYWIVFAAVSILDGHLSYVLSFIPLYHFIKLGFFIILFHPTFKGAEKVYDNV